MEKLKELFNLAVEYCKNEPFHAAVLGGIAAVVLITLIALIARGSKAKKARKAAKKAALAAAQQTQAEETGATTENAAEATEELAPAPVAKETVTPAPAAEEKAVESVPAPTVEEETAAEEVKTEEEPSKEEEKTEAEPVKEEQPAIKTQVKSAPAKKAEAKTASETEQKPKEGVMLHDEFKDVNTDLDFYEEDETDRVARYSGKWVVCRVVTDDNADDEMYFFELHASNGEKLLSSEEYTTYNGAIRGIQTHKSNILRDNFRITLSKKGDYIFKLLNGKGMLLCMGEHYATRARCESAIESAKRFAKTAFVDENIQDQVVKVPVEDDSDTEPLHESYNGKWVIDCHISEEGEKVFYFELYANNGERLLSSEEYASYIGAVNGIQTHKANIEKGNFRISLTKHGDYIYKLLNGNGQLLCLGEHYKTKRRCLNAVESVKRFAMNSPILTDPELTK